MTKTPWGNADELRARKLAPGEKAPQEEVERSQRERLFAAMVAVSAERGYEATTVADLVALSGVSRAAFYQHFENKEQCFLATQREILDAWAKAVATRYDGQGSAVAAFIDLIVGQPAAARMCFVEYYAAGPEAVAAMNVPVRGVETLFKRYFDEQRPGAEIPTGMEQAIVGGLRKVVYTRLRSGRETELSGLLKPLQEWILGYVPPPKPLRRKSLAGPAGSSGLFQSEEPAERMMAAALATIVERGYQATTIKEVARRASVSFSTFLEHFDGKEDILVAILDAGRAQLFSRTLPAFQRAREWPEQVHSAFEAMFAFFAAEQAFARVAMVEVYAAGTTALDRRDRSIEVLERFLEPGYELAPDTPRISSELIGGAVYELLYRQTQNTSKESLSSAAPLATYIALAPFLGAEEACVVANAAAPLVR